MNVLLTGASGFLGSRIYQELTQQHIVTTLGRTPVGNRHIHCDLTQSMPMLSRAEPYDFVVNLAGKAPSTARSAVEGVDYKRLNVHDTIRLLSRLEQLPTLPKSFVHISTVLVYGRSEGQMLTEITPPDAIDTYRLSKVGAETIVRLWSERTGVRLTILRLPLVVAERPNGNLAAMSKAIRRGYHVRIGIASASRSMVRADDIAAVITRAVEVGGTFNLTDGHHPTVCELESAMARQVGRTSRLVVPSGLAKFVAHIGDGINALVHRLYLRQNIFQAHRMHLFQMLVHQLKWQHLHVSALYALL